MPFSSFLGNARIKDNLTSALQQGKLAHFYLICGPAGSGKRTLARLLAAAALCQGECKPCCSCTSCRKVLNDVHPDVTFVTDGEHKTVPVRVVRQMRDDAFIRPGEGERKIYILAQELGPEGQNALLKILEEPPQYGMFLLLSENPESILPTVRSRCVELQLQPLSEADFAQAFAQLDGPLRTALWAQSGGFLGQAKAMMQQDRNDSLLAQFVQAMCTKDSLLLTRLFTPMEKKKRDELIPIFQQWTQLLAEALAVRCGGQSPSQHANRLARERNAPELNAAVELLRRCTAYAQQNVSCAAICGYLSWALR